MDEPIIERHHDHSTNSNGNEHWPPNYTATTTKDIKGVMSHIPQWRRLTVGPIVFLYLLSYIAVSTNMTQYGYYSVGLQLFPNGTGSLGTNSTNPCTVNISSIGFKNYMTVQKTTSDVNLYFTIATGLPAIFTNIVFGTLTDTFGRKFLFIVPTIGSFVKTVICALGIYYGMHIYFFIIAFVIEGFTGLFFSMLQVSYSYVADVTSKDKGRSFGITCMEIAVGLGTVLGSLAAGYFIDGFTKPYGYLWCMVASAGLLVITLILIVFILPETTIKKKKKFSPKHFKKYITNVFSFYFFKNKYNSRWKYIVCITVFALVTITVMGRLGVETLLQLGFPFCWDAKKISYFGTIRGATQQVVGMGMIKLLQVCMNDHAIAILGTVSAVASFVMEAFAKHVGTDLYFYLVPVVGAGSVLTMPMIRAIMSKLTPADKQGAMFAGVAAVETTGFMVSGILTNAIYGKTVGLFQGFVFLVLAMFSFSALVLLVLLVAVSRCLSARTTPIETTN